MFSSTLSTAIGAVIIAMSMFSKIPQILKIHKNRSGEGINIVSVTMDLMSITGFMAYSYVQGFPFSSWGDALFLSVQTMVIAVLILAYDGAPAKATSYIAVYMAVCYVLMSGLTPIDLLWTYQSTNILVYIMGKLMQINTNYQNGHTGQLSDFTTYLLFLGSLARIYTSIVETGDQMIIFTNVIATIANGLVAAQILYYKAETDMLNKVE